MSMEKEDAAKSKNCPKCGSPMRWIANHWVCYNGDCDEAGKKIPDDKKTSLLGKSHDTSQDVTNLTTYWLV